MCNHIMHEIILLIEKMIIVIINDCKKMENIKTIHGYVNLCSAPEKHITMKNKNVSKIANNFLDWIVFFKKDLIVNNRKGASCIMNRPILNKLNRIHELHRSKLEGPLMVYLSKESLEALRNSVSINRFKGHVNCLEQ